MNTYPKQPLSDETPAHGTVKWFDATRSFGFVVVPGFETDFLLHGHVLYKFGRTSIADGSFIQFHHEKTRTGLKVTEVLSIKAPEGDAEPTDPVDARYVSNELVAARVKWFDPNKGYGFVNRFGHAEDIFVGKDILKKSALQTLSAGEALCIQFAEVDGRKSVVRVFDWHVGQTNSPASSPKLSVVKVSSKTSP